MVRAHNTNNQKWRYPDGYLHFWWLARGSIHCGVDAVKPSSNMAPPEPCIEWFEPITQIIKNGDTRMGISISGGSPGARYSTVGNQFLNWLPATPHRGVAFCYSSPDEKSKMRTPKRASAFLVARQGLEPWTHALKGRCSTN